MSKDLEFAIALLGSIVGAIGTALGILTAKPMLRNSSIAILLISAVGILIWILIRIIKNKRIARQEIDIDAFESISVTSYRLVRAEMADIIWISKLEHKRFKKLDAIPLEVLQEWYIANPNAFYILKNKEGERVGHIDVLPIKGKTLELLKNGKIRERDIRGDCLFTRQHKENVRNLYIESVIVQETNLYLRGKAFAEILASMRKIASSLAIESRIENLFALSATADGERNLKKLGFRILKEAKERKDKHDFYCAEYKEAKEKIIELLSRMRIRI